ncbi:VPA1269 family protein [Klebsiella pneumoniae]
MLYWLEKLRNWQEKYNPIAKPTECTLLLKSIYTTGDQTDN